MPDSPPRIDFHTHFFYDRAYLTEVMAEWDLRVCVINITGKRFFREPMAARWEAMLRIKEAHPDRVALCTSMDLESADQPDAVDEIISGLRVQIEQGACMVKVWKDVGLELRDADGRYVQIDDPRFRPIWDFLASEGIPVLAHVAEPKAAWLPLDADSPHYRYYRDNPQYHLSRQAEIPAWEHILEARDNWLKENPDLTIIGAHFGSMEHDVEMVGDRLDDYPNFYVDTAERFGDLVIQPSDAVRSFFLRHEDRILYGTDFITDTVADEVSAAEQGAERLAYESLLETHEAYLAGTGKILIQDKLVDPVEVEALDLPPEVLDKIYRRNALRFLRFN